MSPVVSVEHMTLVYSGAPDWRDTAHFQLSAGGRVSLRRASGAGKPMLWGLISGALVPKPGGPNALGHGMATTIEPAR